MSTLKQRYDRASWTILVSIFLTIVILFGQYSPGTQLHSLFDRLDALLYDIRFNLTLKYKEPVKGTHKIIIVDIDEYSLKEVGRWPWHRNQIAHLTQNLLDAGAAVITFDMVFSEPEQNIVSIIENETASQSPELRKRLSNIKSQFDYDQILADTFYQHDIVLGYIFHPNPFITESLPATNIIYDQGRPEKTLITDMKGYTTNLALLQKNVLAEGFMNAPPDDDGIVRRAPLVMNYDNQTYSSLALQTVLAYTMTDDVIIHTVPSGESHTVTEISINDQQIVTDEKGRILIPYRSGKGYFPYVSAAKVLKKNFDETAFTGAIVFIGTSAVGLADLRGTPVGIQYPGVESQATIVDAILSQDVPYKPDWSTGANIVAIALVFFLLNAVFPLCGPVLMVLYGSAISFSLIGINFWLWSKHGIDLPIAGVLTEALAIFMFYLAYGFVFSSQQKNQIHNMFGQYVAPAHIEKLLNTPDKLSFEGETKEMTVMFCDIRRFTTISEKLTANQLKEFLNSYFTPMTEVIFSQQGTIDKYVGDMIMAFWGAPLDDPEQKIHAVTTALMMIEKTKTMKAQLIERGFPEVSIGIGINTGMMNVGDMGSIYRRAYTVLGDAVNLGSRLESITKFYGANILISETTLTGIADRILYREVDYIQVKGKNEAIKVYEPLCLKEKASPEQINFVQAFNEARKIFLNRQWQDAKAAFRDLIADDPDSTLLYSVYVERCIMYTMSPPDQHWQGVWKHDAK